VFFVHRTGKEAILPEIAAEFVFFVETLGVLGMGSAKDFFQTVFKLRHSYDVNVIRHPCEGMNGQVVPFARFQQ